MDSYIRAAFDKVFPDAKPTGSWFVCLMQDVPFYGGPEEGGWWGSDTSCVAYREYQTKEQAEEAKTQVGAVAIEMSEESRRLYDRHCAETCDWLEERGLDPEFLPEPDGPTDYYVIVSDSIPEPRYGSRRYE